ncbi:MAG: extracellular solute-binding protein [Alphaproteobacteria bacterium]|nr:extracellular solute-binding protein [Alphaproteobacteria bacterium]
MKKFGPMIILALSLLTVITYTINKGAFKSDVPSTKVQTAPLVAVPEPKNIPIKKTIALPATAVRSLSRFGKPLYPDNFAHFNHVNPDAPKGGTLRLGTVGGFDSINNFIVMGIAAQGVLITHETLMVRAVGEPFTLYGLLAEGVELAPNNSSITFYLNPNARFHDGSPVTAEDVRFTIELLRDKGWPRYRQHYSRIDKMEIINPTTIKISFKPNDSGQYDPELPLGLSMLYVLSKAQLSTVDFANSGLTVIMGSGPYRVGAVDQGRSITYQRDPNYWAKDLPVNKGQYNFDTIRIDYFKNAQSQFQAFTAGEFDAYFETNPNQWQTGYNFAAVKDGRVEKVNDSHRRPVPVKTIIFNMRRPVFSDSRIRQALGLALDFDTLNKMVFYGTMKCPNSLFANTFLAHHGPAVGKEKEILQKYASRIEPGFFKTMLEKEFSPARTDGNGDQRANLAEADRLLKEAGWTIKNGKRVNDKGQIMTFEFMIKDPLLEKIVLAYRESLKKLGINLSVRMMDAVQYENRVIDRDFDMMIHAWANSLSPGNEQPYYFGVKVADVKGSSNHIGMKDPIAEELAKNVTQATDQETQAAAVHALDRYVMYSMYQIPLMYDNNIRWAYWVDKVAHPKVDPEIGTNVMNWGWSPQIK